MSEAESITVERARMQARVDTLHTDLAEALDALAAHDVEHPRSWLRPAVFKEARLRRGWTVEFTARVAGLSRSTVHRYETGCPNGFRYSMVGTPGRLVDALGLDFEAVLAGDEFIPAGVVVAPTA